MSLIEMLGKAAFSPMSQNAAKKTGVNETAIAALMPMAAAILMNGIKKNVASPGGAEALAKALTKHDGNLLNNLGAAADDNVMTDGRAILGHILGGKQSATEATLAKATGLGQAEIGKLLAMAAPVVLAGLGRAQRQQKLNPAALADHVRAESAKAQQAAPTELTGMLKWLDTDGDGRIDDNLADLAQKGLSGLFKR